MSKFVFVIDTDSYAGNFEREMCAYITGVVGDCGVGDEFQNIYLKETGEEESVFLELLEQRPDEHGNHRPCSIWPTTVTTKRNGTPNSVAIFFYKKPSEKMINLMKDRANKFAETKRQMGESWDKNFKLIVHGFRLIEEKTTSSEIKI